MAIKLTIALRSKHCSFSSQQSTRREPPCFPLAIFSLGNSESDGGSMLQADTIILRTPVNLVGIQILLWRVFLRYSKAWPHPMGTFYINQIHAFTADESKSLVNPVPDLDMKNPTPWVQEAPRRYDVSCHCESIRFTHLLQPSPKHYVRARKPCVQFKYSHPQGVSFVLCTHNNIGHTQSFFLSLLKQ